MAFWCWLIGRDLITIKIDCKVQCGRRVNIILTSIYAGFISDSVVSCDQQTTLTTAASGIFLSSYGWCRTDLT
jgi:hypothetical protein